MGALAGFGPVYWPLCRLAQICNMSRARSPEHPSPILASLSSLWWPLAHTGKAVVVGVTSPHTAVFLSCLDHTPLPSQDPAVVPKCLPNTLESSLCGALKPSIMYPTFLPSPQTSSTIQVQAEDKHSRRQTTLSTNTPGLDPATGACKTSSKDSLLCLL